MIKNTSASDVNDEVVGKSKATKEKELPPLAEIRAAIPKHCFEHSTVTALSLVLRDGLIIAAIFFIAKSVLRVPGDSANPANVLDLLGWVLYAFVEGSAAIGWWVLAHECGHGGFSASRTLNDVVGWVLHSLMLVPYFSWQFSHAKHHSKTNHLMDGESHVPDTRAELEKVYMHKIWALLGDDCFAVLELFNHLVVGWPMYLIFNVTGGRRLNGKALQKPIPGLVDHFRPGSDLFPEGWWWRIFLSSVGIMATLAGLVWASVTYGFATVACFYLGPYLVVNAWLVGYTWLQHTDPKVPHYGDDEWTWLKGALGTIDRPYGIFDWMHHYIGSTHVCHHLFSSLPCYHAVEATAHLKAYLEPKGLYNYDPSPWPVALWNVAKHCHFVEDVKGTQYPKSFSAGDKKKM